MTERPILFSGPMVRAILAGRKTQTRRVVKGLGVFVDTETAMLPPTIVDGKWMFSDGTTTTCPFGTSGDRLWVRETWSPMQRHRPIANPEIYDNKPAWYAADNDRPTWAGSKWRPSIFMPRAASRLTLEIIAVRVERLHDIDEEDAIAEGVDFNGGPVRVGHTSAVSAFKSLWDSINGEPAPWESNPWVWVITFRSVEG